MNVNHIADTRGRHSLAVPAAVSASSMSAEGGGSGAVSTVVIGLFTLITTLLALYLMARGRTRDDHRGDD